MPGARCTRGLVCKVAQRKAHTSIQVQRRQSGIPCARESTGAKNIDISTGCDCCVLRGVTARIDGAIKPHKVLSDRFDRRSDRRRSCPRPRRIRPQLTGTWSLAQPRDQGRLLVDEIIAVKAQKVEWVK